MDRRLTTERFNCLDTGVVPEVREGLADVISMHEMLTNQILATVPFWDSSNTLASVCKTNTGAVLTLQIKQPVNYEY